MRVGTSSSQLTDLVIKLSYCFNRQIELVRINIDTSLFLDFHNKLGEGDRTHIETIAKENVFVTHGVNAGTPRQKLLKTCFLDHRDPVPLPPLVADGITVYPSSGSTDRRARRICMSNRSGAASTLASLLRSGATLSPEITPSIEAAVAREIAGRSLGSPEARLQAAFRVIQRLHRSGAYDAAFALLAATPTIARLGPHGVLLRLQVLETAGKLGTLKKALGEVPVDLGTRQGMNLLKMRLRQRVPFVRADVEAATTVLSADAREVLERMDITAAIEEARPDAAKLHPLCAEAMDLDAFTRRLAFGRALNAFFRMVRVFDPGDPLLAALARSAADLMRPFDSQPVLAAAQSGRSILVTRAHTGIGLIDRNIPGLHLPELQIARKEGNVSAKGRTTLLDTRAMNPADFMRTVKLVKKTPHQINVFPDGPDGAERRRFPLCGRSVSLGLGAATLAWYGRAATFFITTRWNDGALGLCLWTGPVAPDFTDKEAFEDALWAFYLDRLREIVTGPPEDMGGPGGFWTDLATTPEHPPEPEPA